MPYVVNVNKDFDNHVLVTLKGGHRVFGSYIPPSDSIYYKDEYFYTVPGFLSPVDSDSIFIGGGDFNSRVGDRVYTSSEFNGRYRRNPDPVVNNHGRMLKDICKNSKCYLLNNLNYGEKIFDGDFTFEKAGNKSQNDACISNTAGLKKTKSFCIHNIDFNFSDHKPISVSIEIPVLEGVKSSVIAEDILSSSWEKTLKRERKIVSENVDWKAYEALVNLKLQNIVDETRGNEFSEESFQKSVNEVDTALHEAALFCQNNSSRSNDTVSDFVEETRSVEEIQNDISRNECEMWRKIINNNNSSDLWKEIAWKGSKNDVHSCTPSAKEFGEYFVSKATIEGEEPFTLEDVVENTECPILDDPISVAEVHAAEKRLKEGKSSSDGWTPGMIRSVSGLLFPLLVMIFNTILQLSYYPETWRNTVVNALFKNKGFTWLPKYFRPISLVKLLAKMFDFVLLARFTKWFKPHDCQSAYQSGKGGADHVFLIRALINHCVSTGEKLFIICIDFEGAFDKVSRHRLFRKLQLFGAGSLFLTCLMTIYSFTPCTIFGNESSYTYLLLAGIKQGLPLSPWLFLFYINDIFDFFDGIYGKTSLLETIHLLIHADDTTILASSREKAEAKLKSLLQYCALNHISLQLSKCEFIVINGELKDMENIKLTEGSVKHVSFVTLLGSQLSESGSIEDDLKFHMRHRYPAVTKFFNFLRNNKLAPTAVKLKVLQACVTSALLHNCEAFGDLIPDDLERIYFSLIKSALGVRKSTANDLVLIESGLLTLKGMIHSRQYKFYETFIENLQPDGARHLVFLALRNNGNKFLKHYSDLLHTHQSPTEVKTYHRQQNKEKVKRLASSDNHYKYQLYATFNPELKPGDLSKSYSFSFSRLRLSSHSMPVELGRWNRLKRDVRLCSVCKTVGDERHFIYSCPTIDRSELMDLPPMDKLAEYEKLPTLLKSLEFYL